MREVDARPRACPPGRARVVKALVLALALTPSPATPASTDRAAPVTTLAIAIGESLTVVDDVAETVRRLRTGHVGRTLLVVGHSNTGPDIVAALTGRPFPTPDDVAYDGMWVVTLSRDGRASLLTLRYGEPAEGAASHASPARR